MSETRDPATDQRLPVPNGRPFVQDLVITDIADRKRLGIRKYGTALQSGNGRDMLLDLYQELMDAVIYVRGAIDDRQRLVDDADAATSAALLSWAAERLEAELEQLPRGGSHTRAWWAVNRLRDYADAYRREGHS